MKSVFIILAGEAHEGGEVKSVHFFKETAMAMALLVPTHFEGGWKQINDQEWTNGCDWVKVEEWNIIP